jgi:hypothetical protein
MQDPRMMADTAGPNNSFNHKGHKGTRSIGLRVPFVLGCHAHAQAAREGAGIQPGLDFFRNLEDADLAAEGTL